MIGSRFVLLSRAGGSPCRGTDRGGGMERNSASAPLEQSQLFYKKIRVAGVVVYVIAMFIDMLCRFILTWVAENVIIGLRELLDKNGI